MTVIFILVAARASTANTTPPPLAPPSPPFRPVVHVSPTGSDSGDGSPAHPYQSLGRARDAARVLMEANAAAVTVQLSAGVFYLEQALTLGDEVLDSNTAWVGAGAGTTTVRGGRPVTGWEPAPEAFPLPTAAGFQVWRASNPWPGQQFYQLVEGREPATPAR
jgi:hypothetical protein